MEWIPVTERLPDGGFAKALVAERGPGGCIMQVAYFYPGNKKEFITQQGDVFYATHWMPLPEPPKQ